MSYKVKYADKVLLTRKFLHIHSLLAEKETVWEEVADKNSEDKARQ